MAQQIEFLKHVLPFYQLDQAWLQETADALDVVYFPVDSMIALDLEENAFLYLVIKGRVAEFESVDDRHPLAYYSEYSQFGAIRLLDHESKNIYQAVEESVLYRLSHAFFQRLLQYNPGFERFYQQDITQKLTRLHKQLRQESSSEAMMDVVKNAPLHTLVQLDSATTIQTCVEQMELHKTDACLIQKDDQFGVVTSSDLLRGLALHGCNLQTPILDLATFPVISIHQDDYLFNALLEMTRHGVDRLIVRDDQGFTGVLHQIELMSLFANQSGLVMLALDRAKNLEDLQEVTLQIDRLVQGLSNKGVRTHYIALLVNELQRKLQARLWQVLDPKNQFDNATLIVMGSEGRFEQVVRTDQDNALIIDDNLIKTPGLVEFAQTYTENLIALGFPPCPGNIMISNPIWRLSETEFDKQVRHWFEQPSLESYMNIAILFDAQVVRGDEVRLQQLKARLFAEVKQHQVFLAHFARSVLQFETPIGLFGRLITQADQGHTIDLKKGGIFTIVHGVRCLAMEQGIEKTNTHWRIRALIEAGVFEERFGIELDETLDFFNTLRLDAMLNKQATGQEVDNRIDIDRLSHLQQDLLKEAFGVVNQFKKFIQQYFKLERVM